MATLGEVVTDILRQGDLEGDPHVGTGAAGEIEKIAIRAYRQAWGILLSCAKTYFIKTHTFTLAGGLAGQSYDLDANVADFFETYKLERDASGGGVYDEDVWPFELIGRNRLNRRGFTIYGDGTVKTLLVEPYSAAEGSYRLWYVYKPADPTTGDPLIDPVGLVEQFVIDTGAIRARIKEESDTAELRALRDELRQDMITLASSRQGPREAVDVRRGPIFGYMGRRRWND